jgi:hypothetical protein
MNQPNGVIKMGMAMEITRLETILMDAQLFMESLPQTDTAVLTRILTLFHLLTVGGLLRTVLTVAQAFKALRMQTETDVLMKTAITTVTRTQAEPTVQFGSFQMVQTHSSETARNGTTQITMDTVTTPPLLRLVMHALQSLELLPKTGSAVPIPMATDIQMLISSG